MTDAERKRRPRPGVFVQLLQRHYRLDDLDGAGDMLDANPAAGWVYGVLMAGLVVGYGVWVLVQGQAWLPQFGGGKGFAPRQAALVLIAGPIAFWYGVAVVALGLLLHFHSFWGTHRKLSRYHELLWYPTLLVTLFATGMLAYHSVRKML